MEHEDLPSGSLVATTTRTGVPTYRAKWRDSSGRQCSPTIGRAWIVRDGGEWKPKSGRAKPGYFDQARAYVRMAELIAAHERKLKGGAVEPSEPSPVLIEDLADAYLDYLSRGGRAKPSTLRDHRAALAMPGDRKRGSDPRSARIMRQFGGREATSITTAEFAAFIDSLVVEGLAPRSVNKYREILHAMFEFGKRPGTFGLTNNPVTETEKQRTDGPRRVETFTLDELEQIAEVARQGLHHDRPVGNYGPAVLREWQRRNEQDAAIFLLAAFTGLRRGELLALRWRNIDFGARLLVVDAAVSGGEISTTKSRRIRTLPLTEASCRQLEIIARRKRWCSRDDFVFCGATGNYMDGTMLSKRFRRAQEQANVRVRRFHDLRHTFGTTAVRRFELPKVKEWMGHANLTTTQRYLHSRPRPDDAKNLADAFESSRDSTRVGGQDPSKDSIAPARGVQGSRRSIRIAGPMTSVPVKDSR